MLKISSFKYLNFEIDFLNSFGKCCCYGISGVEVLHFTFRTFQLDIMVHNAGRSQRARWEFTDLQVDKDMFDLVKKFEIKLILFNKSFYTYFDLDLICLLLGKIIRNSFQTYLKAP